MVGARPGLCGERLCSCPLHAPHAGRSISLAAKHFVVPCLGLLVKLGRNTAFIEAECVDKGPWNTSKAFESGARNHCLFVGCDAWRLMVCTLLMYPAAAAMAAGAASPVCTGPSAYGSHHHMLVPVTLRPVGAAAARQ